MPTNMNPTIVHIGYHKAASSTLQAFFSECSSVLHVDRGIAFKHLTSPNALTWDESTASDFFAEQAQVAASSGSSMVISHERLSGNPHSGHYDDTLIAQRIEKILPNARILICVREQLALIASIYKQYLRIGGTKSFRQYVTPTQDYRVPGFDHTKYEYHRLVEYYYGLFGSDRVHICFVEDMRSDPGTFFNYIVNVLETKMPENYELTKVYNLAEPDASLAGLRRTNYFETYPTSIRDPHFVHAGILRGTGRFLTSLLPARDPRPEDESKALFSGYYRDSNGLLASMLNVDLAAKGYDISS